MKTQQTADTQKSENDSLEMRREVRIPENVSTKRFSMKPSRSLVKMKSIRPLAIAPQFSGMKKPE